VISATKIKITFGSIMQPSPVLRLSESLLSTIFEFLFLIKFMAGYAYLKAHAQSLISIQEKMFDWSESKLPKAFCPVDIQIDPRPNLPVFRFWPYAVCFSSVDFMRTRWVSCQDSQLQARAPC
jgi:hypothetical protein